MKNCRNCRKKDCEFRGVKYENLTIYCGEHCAKELKEECDKIATKEFREVIDHLKNGGFAFGSVKGILTQAQCILNVADNKTV